MVSAARALMLGVAVFALNPAPLTAADYLRGAITKPEPAQEQAPFDWAGVYAGGHVGYSTAGISLTGLRSVVNAAALTPLADFERRSSERVTYGGFVGYNVLWDDVVLGLEADYTRAGLRSNRTGQNFAAGITENVTAEIDDIGLLKARVGWAFGQFLPYATVGVAIANMETAVTRTNTVPPPTANVSLFRDRSVNYGLAAGLGVDVALVSNFFLRAEWQYFLFTSENTAAGRSRDVSANLVRIGAGAKF